MQPCRVGHRRKELVPSEIVLCVFFPRELGDSMTVYQCHFVLGTLHQKERHTSSALDCFKRALAVARELRDRTKEADTLREMAQVQ